MRRPALRAGRFVIQHHAHRQRRRRKHAKRGPLRRVGRTQLRRLVSEQIRLVQHPARHRDRLACKPVHPDPVLRLGHRERLIQNRLEEIRPVASAVRPQLELHRLCDMPGLVRDMNLIRRQRVRSDELRQLDHHAIRRVEMRADDLRAEVRALGPDLMARTDQPHRGAEGRLPIPVLTFLAIPIPGQPWQQSDLRRRSRRAVRAPVELKDHAEIIPTSLEQLVRLRRALVRRVPRPNADVVVVRVVAVIVDRDEITGRGEFALLPHTGIHQLF